MAFITALAAALVLATAKAWTTPTTGQHTTHQQQLPSFSLRSGFASACAERWLGSAVSRGKVAYSTASVAVQGRSDFVVGVSGSNVSWYGEHAEPRLSLSRVDLEVSSPHRRVLSRGRKGGFRATVSLSSRDVEQSAWIRQGLRRLLKRVLREIDPSKKLESFGVKFEDSKVRLDAQAQDLKFSITSRLEAENGAATLREPTVELWGGLPFYKRGNMLLPAPVVERLGSLYLSTVALDASRGNCKLTKVRIPKRRKCVEFTVVSGPPPSATVLEKHNTGMSRHKEKKRQRRTTEWRVDKESLETMFAGDAPHPLRHTYNLGEQWPWIVNPRNSAPLRVSAAFAVLALTLSAIAVPETALRAVLLFGKKCRASGLVKFGHRFLKIATWPIASAIVVAGRSILDVASLFTPNVSVHRQEEDFSSPGHAHFDDEHFAVPQRQKNRRRRLVPAAYSHPVTLQAPAI
mmetsp:Transcript_36915/g.118327  ORF Transcript_36915/g.118327 Transcript_36915/m.118327 type:complete len:462 (-) Transcript_36915:3367-4752(-)